MTRKYLRNKKLTLSKKKTKMLVFNRGKKKKRKMGVGRGINRRSGAIQILKIYF